jgi:hypothetical protein
VRIPIKATAREPINRPDTYQRLPLSTQTFTCDQQPVHTLRQEPPTDVLLQRESAVNNGFPSKFFGKLGRAAG